MSATQYTLSLACADQPGIVFTVSRFILNSGGNILESQQYDDPLDERFFMRVQFEVAGASDLDLLRRACGEEVAPYAMEWQLHDTTRRTRTLIMVSRFGHCLNDLLYRWTMGELNIEIAGVVSNHTDFEDLIRSHGLDFHHIPVTPDTKPAAEAELLSLVESRDVDLVVLARYMQVLSDDASKALDGRAINIHHSFLPSFKGARPYDQAHQRGVKLVGATAHYVTAHLDEGPIIEQDVVRVDHRLQASQLVSAGRDVESRVLSKAVRWHCENRVLLNGHRTVVFS